ncbi:MAG: MBL fold metallo-hydrolase, partial [Candidatus Hydrothermarchaeales archaeon]
RNSSSEKAVDAVLLTHAHVDHYGYVPLMKEGIDIYLGKGTKEIIDIRNETTTRSWDKVIDHLTFKTFRTGNELQVGDISFKPIHVDHSVPAAYGYVIYAGDKTIAYTGDLRPHGHVSQLTEDFISQLDKEDVDVLITEGTNVAPKEEDDFLKVFESEFKKRMGMAPERKKKSCDTEGDVEKKLKETIGEAEGLMIVETSPADVDRMRSLWKATEDNDRSLVLDPKQAYLLFEIGERDAAVKDLPTPKSSYILLNRMKDRNAEVEGTETYKKWRYEFQQKLIGDCEPNVLWGKDGRGELRGNPEKYVLCTSNATARFLELKGEKDFKCDFILSKSEPFNEELVISFDKLLHWLTLFGMKKYYQMHVSGHFSKDKLFEVLNEIDPKKIFPIHTEYPEMFKDTFSNVQLLEKGKRYEI